MIGGVGVVCLEDSEGWRHGVGVRTGEERFILIVRV